MKTIHLVTIAYNLADCTQLLIDSAFEETREFEIYVHLFLHSNRSEVVQVCEEAAVTYKDRLSFYNYQTNRGLSCSWNEGILSAREMGADVTVISNDDVAFNTYDLDKLAKKALSHPENHMISVAGVHTGFNKKFPSHGYSCFAINPISLEKIGMFDENIFPIYLEDCDHAYRAKMLGLVEANCPDTMVMHGGSSSIKTDHRLSMQNATTHHQNGEYYKRKWGGYNEREQYRTPFNNPSFDYYISPDNRHRPYGPPFDRTDQAIVKF